MSKLQLYGRLSRSRPSNRQNRYANLSGVDSLSSNSLENNRPAQSATHDEMLPIDTYHPREKPQKATSLIQLKSLKSSGLNKAVNKIEHIKMNRLAPITERPPKESLKGTLTP